MPAPHLSQLIRSRQHPTALANVAEPRHAELKPGTNAGLLIWSFFYLLFCQHAQDEIGDADNQVSQRDPVNGAQAAHENAHPLSSLRSWVADNQTGAVRHQSWLAPIRCEFCRYSRDIANHHST
jgi:hypothetical protein